ENCATGLCRELAAGPLPAAGELATTTPSSISGRAPGLEQARRSHPDRRKDARPAGEAGSRAQGRSAEVSAGLSCWYELFQGHIAGAVSRCGVERSGARRGDLVG